MPLSVAVTRATAEQPASQCRLLSFGGEVGGNNRRQGGAGLGTCWGRELAEKMLADAGLREIAVEKLPHDDMNYYIARK